MERVPSTSQSVPHASYSITKGFTLPSRLWRDMVDIMLKYSGKRRSHTLSRLSPYAQLKAGRTSAILAVLDNGTISFQRFGETDFSELPWVGNGAA